MKKVVITGMGCVSPLGNSLQQSWNSLLQLKSGIQQVNEPSFWQTNQTNLGLVKQFDFQKYKVPFTNNRINNFIKCACQQALNDSKMNLNDIQLRQQTGVCLGIMGSNTTQLTNIIHNANHDFTKINRMSMFQILANIPTANISIQYQLEGPTSTIATACASGLSAIGHAYRLIQNNQCIVMITGGAEDIYSPTILHSAIKLQAMSTKIYNNASQASRPFDSKRSGFILSQGAGILILEQYQHAIKRGAKIYAQIIGFSTTSDGYHLTRPVSDGKGIKRSMINATKEAKIKPQDVNVFNCHATSTMAGDQCQALAIYKYLGQSKVQKRGYVTAMKSYLGHTFGAAGAIESILGIVSMNQKIMIPILNLQSEPEGIQLNYVKKLTEVDNCRIMMKNALGFGGINVSMIYKRME